MKVERFEVGPILGATTGDSIRVFGRGGLVDDGGTARRAHGAIQVRAAGSPSFGAPLYFKLNPNFDMTGVVVVAGLDEKTDYEYQAGWFHSEVDTANLDVAGVLDWSDVETRTFRTASNQPGDGVSLIMGSCRYLLRLFGGSLFDDRGDKTFRSILRQIEDGQRVDQLLMVGDQIYADDLNFVSPDSSLDEYNDRYRNVFSQRWIRELMGRVPTYMTLDDHEIEDNWPASASTRDWLVKFPAAAHAYLTYQMSHGPLFSVQGSRIAGVPEHFWYSYSDGCCDVFVTDTRTERELGDVDRQIVSETQLQALVDWLGDGSPRVKVIVSAVPLYESKSSDKWNGFVAQRDRLLEAIRGAGLKRVVFFSGDVHASMSSELHVEGDPGFRIVSVVSSAFFWPYPHPLKRQFHLAGEIDTATNSLYRVENASDVRRTDNFTRIDIDPAGVHVRVYGRKGDLLGSKRHDFPQ